jgi:hypothetical protein
MRSSNGRGDVNRDIPVTIRKEDGVLVEAASEARLL